MNQHRLCCLEQTVSQPFVSSMDDPGLSIIFAGSTCKQIQATELLNLLDITKTVNVAHLSKYTGQDVVSYASISSTFSVLGASLKRSVRYASTSVRCIVIFSICVAYHMTTFFAESETSFSWLLFSTSLVCFTMYGLTCTRLIEFSIIQIAKSNQ